MITIDWNRLGGPYHETCPDCHLRTKNYNEPTLSTGNFLDRMIFCDCGWCGVNSVALTELEAKEFLSKPKQLRLEI